MSPQIKRSILGLPDIIQWMENWKEKHGDGIKEDESVSPIIRSTNKTTNQSNTNYQFCTYFRKSFKQFDSLVVIDLLPVVNMEFHKD